MNRDDNSIYDYWKQNFSNKNIIGASNDLQINIARTKKGKRVNEEIWTKTISYLIEKLNITGKSNVMELCCGNGVIIGEIAPFCNHAYGVDYSKALLDQLQQHYHHKNLNFIKSNVETYEFDADLYDAIIIYFAIQHFNERSAFLLIEKCIQRLRVNGKLLIGDIPDLDKKWTYINKESYHKDYFKRLVELTPKIGHWFQKDFFKAMNSCFPNTSFKILKQPSYQINSDHCFDVLIEKHEVK